MNIAVVAETAPAKTLIPIIEKVDADILSLTHSEGAMELLGPYSNEIIPPGPRLLVTSCHIFGSSPEPLKGNLYFKKRA